MSHRFNNPEDFRSSSQDTPPTGHNENLFKEAQREQGLLPFSAHNKEEGDSSEQGYLNITPVDYRRGPESGATENPNPGHHAEHACREREELLGPGDHEGHSKELAEPVSSKDRWPARDEPDHQPLRAHLPKAGLLE